MPGLGPEPEPAVFEAIPRKLVPLGPPEAEEWLPSTALSSSGMQGLVPQVRPPLRRECARTGVPGLNSQAESGESAPNCCGDAA